MRLLFFIVFLSFCFVASGQDHNGIFRYKYRFSEADSSSLKVGIQNQNFFKNNEYFGPLEEGYTLLGTWFQPSLIYYPSSKTKLEAGVHLLKFAGTDTMSQVFPVFSFQAEIFRGLHVIIGNINGSLNHNLTEPVFREENHFFRMQETGVQFLADYSRFRSDIWLSWERMIFHGSPFQEELAAGMSGEIFITDTASQMNVSLPFQFIATHRGGQINNSEQPIQTLLNTSPGLAFAMKVNQNGIKQFGTRIYYTGFNDLSPQKRLDFVEGYGLLSEVWTTLKFIRFSAGYWYGKYYFAPKGSPLFSCISSSDPLFVIPENMLVFSKLASYKKIYKDIEFEIRAEAYYNLVSKNFDYSYGLHLVFNREFFIRKF